MRISSRWLSGGAALCLLAACSGDAFEAGAGGGSAVTSSTSASTGGGGEGGAPSCPGVGDSCTECEAASCPAEYCGCYESTECVLMAQCIAKCDAADDGCHQECWTAHPSAISEGALLVNCAGTVCSAGCPGYKPIGDCLVCLYASCPSEMNGCIEKPDCTKLLGCLAACVLPSCETSCYQQFPGGSADAGPVANCLQDKCAAACTP